MKKAGRITLRVGVGLGIVLAAVALMSITAVDYSPYFRADYYTETIGRLHAVTNTAQVQTEQLSAGFGRASLTPTVQASTDEPGQGRFRSLPLAGYGNRRGRPATGVHDDLSVKAAALQVGAQLGVFVSADALIVPREVTELAMARLTSESHLRREQVYLSATHTHASLGGWGQGMVGEAFAGPFQAGVRVWFADRIVAAAQAALADLRPASLGAGSWAAPEFVRNRLVGKQGRVDNAFAYVLIKQNAGATGVLGSYGAHATVLPSSNMEFSADYPGAWQRAVEEATGGTAIFLAGGVGSHGPVAGEGGFAGIERMGRALAAGLLERLPHTPLTNRIAFGMAGLEVSLPALHARLTDGLRVRPWLAKRLLPVGQSTYLQAFRIQDAIWVSTPCDFSGEMALGLKDSFRPQHRQVVITSFNGDYVGYVVSSRYYHLSGYEPRVMSFFGPNVPDYFEELIRALVASVVEP